MSAGWDGHGEFSHNGHGCTLTVEGEDRAKAMEVLVGCLTVKWQARFTGGVPEDLNIMWA